MNPRASYFEVPYSIEAAVLAGGTSSRMGWDKAWLTLGSRSVIENITVLLGSMFGRVRIIANELHRFESLNIPVQPDIYPGRGPLGGIHAALTTARSDAVFIVACDTPFLNAHFIGGLARLLGNHDAVVPLSGGRAAPVCAVYATGSLKVIERLIETSCLKTVELLDEIDTRWVTGTELERLDPEGLALMNLNTPEDYEKARVLVEAKPSILPE